MRALPIYRVGKKLHTPACGRRETKAKIREDVPDFYATSFADLHGDGAMCCIGYPYQFKHQLQHYGVEREHS